MTYPSKELYDFLANNSDLRAVFASLSLPERPSLKIGQLTDKPDTQIAIFDTGGSPYSDRIPVNEVRVQIIVRSNQYDDCMQYLTALRGFLESNTQIPRWAGVYVLSEPAIIGRDSQNLVRGSVNFRILRNTGGMNSNKNVAG